MGAWHRNGVRVGRGGSRVPGGCVAQVDISSPEVSSPQPSPLFPLPAAWCRHGENEKEKKKEMKHLPTAPGMICAFGGVDVGVKTARDNKSFPFEFSIVIPDHLPKVDGGEGASCVRGELCEARMTARSLLCNSPASAWCTTRDYGAEFVLSLPQ